MSEELNALVQTTGGEDPRPEFVSSLRERLAQELDQSNPTLVPVPESEAPTNNDHNPVIVDDDILIIEYSTDEKQDRSTAARTWLAVAAAVIAVAVAGWVLVGIGNDDAELETIDDPIEIEPEQQGAAPAQLIGKNNGLTGGFTVDPGEYQTDALGTDLSFSTEAPSELARHGEGMILFSDITSRNRDDQTLTLRRLPALPDPADLTQRIGEAAWPVDDVAGWIASIDDGVLLTEATVTELGGRDATRFELQVGEPGCGLPNGCLIDTIRRLDAADPIFNNGGRYGVWVVDQGNEDPIIVIESILDAEDEAWFNTVDELVETFEFGDDQPNPRRVVSEGSFDLEAFGGIRLELPDGPAVVTESGPGIAQILAPIEPTPITLFSAPFTLEGEPITSVAQMEAVFAERLYSLTPRRSFEAGGAQVQVFNVDSGDFPEPTFLLGPETSDSAWTPAGSWWVIEDANLGLLIVERAQASATAVGEQLDVWTDDLLRSLEFINR